MPDISFNLTCSFMATNCYSYADVDFALDACSVHCATPICINNLQLDCMLPFGMFAVLCHYYYENQKKTNYMY